MSYIYDIDDVRFFFHSLSRLNKYKIQQNWNQLYILEKFSTEIYQRNHHLFHFMLSLIFILFLLYFLKINICNFSIWLKFFMNMFEVLESSSKSLPFLFHCIHNCREKTWSFIRLKKIAFRISSFIITKSLSVKMSVQWIRELSIHFTCVSLNSD